MRGNSIDSLAAQPRLKPAQETALAALTRGSTFIAAAREAGVNRVTLWRWMQSDPHFRAAYNAWHRESAESARGRLSKLTDSAVNVLEKALNRDDQKIALAMLKHMGMFRERKPGSTDPEVLELQLALQAQRELREAQLAMTRYLLEKAGVRPPKGRDGEDSDAEFIRQIDQMLIQSPLPGRGTEPGTNATMPPVLHKGAVGEGT